MKFKELKNEKLNLEISVVIPKQEIEDEVNIALKENFQNAKIPGFRPGKVPFSILKKKYGVSARIDAVRKKISNAIVQINSEKDIRAMFEPDITQLINEEDKDIEFVLKYELLPEIEMPDWSKITLEKPVIYISEKDTDEKIKDIAGNYKTFKESKEKAKMGDKVVIDSIGKLDGKPFDGGKLEKHGLVLGSGHFIPGFEDQLVGSKAGDEVEVKVTFPEQYHESSLSGKEAIFECKVISVNKPVDTKINDELAKKFQCETLDEFRKKVSDNMLHSFSFPIKTIMKRKLFDILEDDLTFDIPDSLLNQEVNILIEQSNNDLEEFEGNKEIADKSEEEKSKYYTKLATRRVRLGLLLAEYVKIHKLHISEKDIENAIIKQAMEYPELAQKIFELYKKNNELVENLKGPILEEKAIDDLFEKRIKLVEKNYNIEEFEALLKEEEGEE